MKNNLRYSRVYACERARGSHRRDLSAFGVSLNLLSLLHNRADAVYVNALTNRRAGRPKRERFLIAEELSQSRRARVSRPRSLVARNYVVPEARH